MRPQGPETAAGAASVLTHRRRAGLQVLVSATCRSEAALPRVRTPSEPGARAQRGTEATGSCSANRRVAWSPGGGTGTRTRPVAARACVSGRARSVGGACASGLTQAVGGACVSRLTHVVGGAWLNLSPILRLPSLG